MAALFAAKRQEIMLLFNAGNERRYPALTCSMNSFYFDSNGTQFWHKDAAFHRGNNMPAVIRKNGDKAWYVNGRLIRKENAGN